MSAFAIAYTAQSGAVVNITYRHFTTEEVMRTYAPTTDFQRTVGGTQVLAGPSNVSKYIWAVSAVTDKATALMLQELYENWDLDRSTGISAAVAVLDETWGPQQQSSAVFSTAPTWTFVTEYYVINTFGLTEV